MKRIFWLVPGLLLVGLMVLAIPYVIRHTKAESQHGPAAMHLLTGPRTDMSAKPIRFVKDPQSAPAFEMHDISGKVASGSDWKGKVVIIAFWATWCPPCREEIPTFIALQQKFKDRLQIVGISEDDDPPEKVLNFAQQKGINYPIVMATSALIDQYGGVPALPTAFLIDTQGRVVQKHVGLTAPDDYEREIRSLLGLAPEVPVETFVDTGQVFLKNAANATELPGVDMAGLTPEQKKTVLHRMNAESCTCGCKLTLSECRINDSSCPVSISIAAKVVNEVKAGKTKPVAEAVPGSAPAPASVATP
jgi:peroxiredoxin